jgi:hypothetical protein
MWTEENVMEGLGGGLAAMSFWCFIAAVVVAGIWSEVRKRDAQHETMRRIVESGQPLDEAVVDKIFQGDNRIDRDLMTGGLIVIFVAPGLAILGWFLGNVSDTAFTALLGVSLLVAFVGIGLLVASRAAKRSYLEDENKTTKI